MPNYRYTARDRRGQAVNGTLTAPSPDALADELKRMGYLVTRFTPVAEGAGAPAGLPRFTRRVRLGDMAMLNVQLAKMVQVGIPLVTALDTLARQVESPRMRELMADLARTVEAGSSYSDALSRHPGAFPSLVVNMVRAGEASGRLEEILRRLAMLGKRQAELQQQLVTALTYPITLVLFGVGVCTFLVMGIIPKFMAIFTEAGVSLPLPTLILYQVSQVMRRFWLPGLLVLAASPLAAARLLKIAPVRHVIDGALLRVPVLGDLIQKTVLCNTAHTLATLFASGVPVLESLTIAEQTCGNTVIASGVARVRANVQQGGSLADPLRQNPVFPPMFVQMVSIGEGSGALDTMLEEVGSHYDELVQHGIKRVMSLIEPALLIVMGGLVALIMASVLLPLFRMVNVIK